MDQGLTFSCSAALEFAACTQRELIDHGIALRWQCYRQKGDLCSQSLLHEVGHYT